MDISVTRETKKHDRYKETEYGYIMDGRDIRDLVRVGAIHPALDGRVHLSVSSMRSP